MPKVNLEIVMTLSLAEAKILASTLAALPSDHPTDPIWRALHTELERTEDK